MGSVKDLEIISQPKDNHPGKGVFVYSDRYSVFDWGEMPNQIPKKGAALCLIGAFFFEKLAKLGVKTHYHGLQEDQETKKLSDLRAISNRMVIELVRVLRPKQEGQTYDYSNYHGDSKNILVPLEVIYRNRLPAGSSVFRRIKSGNVTWQDLGLRAMPIPGMTLETPILDVSTKLESSDRYISWQEAQKIAVLNDHELSEMKRITVLINNLITVEAEKIGLIHEDGKIEFAFNENRELMLVDILGTPDECRFLYNTIPISKEVARIYYRKTPWYNELEEAKEKDPIHWKDFFKKAPPPLPERLEELISYLYQSFCNGITEKNYFDVPPLKDSLVEIKSFIS